MPPSPPRRKRPGPNGVALGLFTTALVLTAAGAFWAMRGRGGRATGVPVAAPALAVPGPGAAAPAAPEPPAPAVDPRPAFLAARASVECGAARGEAVFVAADRALASIPCIGSGARLRLADGRELLGRGVPGAPPGTSVLEVPGAGARFVPTLAASTLEDGAPLLAGLDGAGPDTVAEATARGLVPRDGRPWLVAADAAGPLAGGIADAEGRLVAVAPSAPPDPERPWLGVPVEAFGEPPGSEPPPAWKEAREAALDEDRRLASDLWNRLRRSAVLIGSAPGPAGVALVVARAGAGRPPAETVSLVIDPPVWGCVPTGRIVDWRTGPRALDGLPVVPAVASRIARLAPPAGGGSVWIGTGSAAIDCDLSTAAADASLSISGSDPVARIPLPPPPAPEAPTAAPVGPGASRAVAGAGTPVGATLRSDGEEVAAGPTEEAPGFEESWRGAFREANGRVAEARRRREELQAQRDQARENFQYVLETQIDADLEVARAAERRAGEALDELDRKASLAAVPRAWRRPE